MKSLNLATLFFELRSRTEGLQRDLDSAEKSFSKTADFIRGNPIAAAGALGVALLGVAARAEQMAAGVEKSFRKVGALVPDLAGQMKFAQRAIAELAVTSGKSQEQLLEEAEAIARGGVDGTADLINRLRVLQDLADAAGGEVTALAGGLDQTLDLFDLSADKAGEVAAKLFAIGQRSDGKASVEEIFAALQASAPAVRRIGLDFDTTAAALAGLLDQGLNAKQAGKELKAMAAEGAAGAAKLRALAGTGIDTADAMEKLATADRLVRESQARTTASLRQGFNNSLIELGTAILPVVNLGLKALVGFLDSINGRTKGITDLAQVATARTLGQELGSGHLSVTDELDTEAVKRFADAITDVRHGIAAGRIDLAALSKEELEGLQQAFTQFGKIQGSLARGTRPNLLAVQKDLERGVGQIAEIQKQIDALLTFRATSTGGTKTPPILSDLATGVKVTAADVRAELEQQLAGFTSTLVDDSEAATAKFLTDMHKKLETLTGAERASLQALVDQVLAAMEARTMLLQAAEEMRTKKWEPSIPLRTDLTASNAELEARTKAIEDAKEEAARKRKEAIQDAQLQAQAIDQAVRGALQLADAFGLISEEASQALQDVSQLAAAVTEFSALSKVPGGASFGELLPSILSIAGAVGSLVAGLFGETPAEKRAREVQQANTDAILALSKSIGVFGGRLSGEAGTKVLGVQEATRATLNSVSALGGVPNLFSLRAELAKLGLSMTDLKDVASSLGISFAGTTPSVAELKQLLDAIAANQLTARTDSFAGQLNQLLDIFEVFDISDPLDQLRQLVALFENPKFGSPALRKALAGLDLSTPEGRAAAEKAVQELVKRLGLKPDQGGITLEELGGMSPEEFRQALLDLEKRLDELGRGGDAQGSTNQFAVQRTITEVQANLLASLLGSSNVWAEQTAKNTAGILAAMGATLPGGGLAPPPTLTTVGAGTVNISIAVTVTGTLDSPTAIRVGKDVTTGALAAVDQELGVRHKIKKLMSGNVTQV